VLTVLGQKGAGKTTYARWLLERTPRAVVVDRFLEYPGAVTGKFNDAVDYLAANWRGPFRLVVRFTDDLHHRELFRFLAVTARRCPTLPIGLVIEEADFFCRPTFIEPTLDALYRYGRHYRLNLLSVARGDTDLHRAALQASDCLVVFRSRKFSGDMRERFAGAELQAVQRLESLVPGAVPEKGRHYLTFPPEEDPAALWAAAQLADAGPPEGGVAPPGPGV